MLTRHTITVEEYLRVPAVQPSTALTPPHAFCYTSLAPSERGQSDLGLIRLTHLSASPLSPYPGPPFTSPGSVLLNLPRSSPGSITPSQAPRLRGRDLHLAPARPTPSLAHSAPNSLARLHPTPIPQPPLRLLRHRTNSISESPRHGRGQPWSKARPTGRGQARKACNPSSTRQSWSPRTHTLSSYPHPR